METVADLLTGQVVQAVGLFAVTNIDDIVILALFFSRTADRPGGPVAVVVGQYLGFAAILAVAVLAALAGGASVAEAAALADEGTDPPPTPQAPRSTAVTSPCC